jgi:hypothetical protein
VLLGVVFVHGEGAHVAVAAGIGQAEHVEVALHFSVFERTAVQRREGAVEADFFAVQGQGEIVFVHLCAAVHVAPVGFWMSIKNER